MVSAVFLLVWFGLTYVLTILVGNYYLIPVWLVVGFFAGHVSVIVFLFINLPIMKATRLTNAYKAYASRSTAAYVNRFALRLNITIEGYEHVPKDGLLTIYANHKSYADPFILLEIFKRPTTFTPKKSVYNLPLIGLWLKYLGAFPIDRESNRNTARAMVDAIKVVKEGMAMIIFPEGGIKDRNEPKMVAMRAGAYRVAMKAEADILPVSLQGTTVIKKRAPFRASRVKVVIHPVVPYENIKNLSTLEVADQIFHIINNHLEE